MFGPQLSAEEQRKKDLAELQRRHEEDEKYRRYFYLNLGRPTWVKVGEADDLAPDVATIGIENDRKLYEDGLYEMQGGTNLTKRCNFNVKDGSVQPAPPLSNVRFDYMGKFAEVYGAAMDFLAAGRGAKVITIDFDKPNISAKELRKLMQLAKEKGLGVSFGPNVEAWLLKQKPSAQKRYINMKNEINARHESRMLMANVQDPTFKRRQDSIAKNVKLDPVADLNANKTTILAGPPPAATVPEKLARVENELKSVNERHAQAKKAMEELRIHQTATTRLLQNPEQLSDAKLYAPGSFAWDGQKRYKELIADNAVKVPEEIKAKRDGAKGDRLALIDALQAEVSDLEKRRAACMDILTNDPDIRDAAPATPEATKRDQLKGMINDTPADPLNKVEAKLGLTTSLATSTTDINTLRTNDTQLEANIDTVLEDNKARRARV